MSAVHKKMKDMLLEYNLKGSKILKKQSFHPTDLFQTTEFGFSHVVAAEGKRLIFCSGQAAQDKNGAVIGKNDFGEQIRKSMDNIETALAEAGSSLDDICRLKLYIVNLTPDKLGIITQEMGKSFDVNNLPANTLIGVQALADPDLLVEIEVTAVAD
jgi:enamine deaminase RidA (YjgF/YER057c/UK114 family)